MTDVVTDPGMTDTLTIIFSEKDTKTTVYMCKHVRVHHKLCRDMQSYKCSKQLHLRVQAGCDTDVIPQRQIDTLYWVGQKVRSGLEKPGRTFPSAQSSELHTHSSSPPELEILLAACPIRACQKTCLATFAHGVVSSATTSTHGCSPT